MKKLILLLFVCAVFSHAEAQQTKTFEINPFGDDKIDCCIPRNTFVKFRISHVNIFKLEGYALAKNVDIDFASPADAFFPAKPSAPADDAAPIADKAAGNDPQAKIAFVIQGFQQDLDKARKAFSLLERNKQRGESDETVRQMQEAIRKQEAVIKKLQEEIDELKKKQAIIDAAKDDFITYYQLLRNGMQKIQRFLKLEAQLDSMLKDDLVRDVDVLKENAALYVESVYGSRLPSACLATLNTTLDDIANNFLLLKKAYEEMNPEQSDSTDFSLEKKSGDAVISMKGKLAKKMTMLYEKEFSYMEKLVNQVIEPDKNGDVFNKAKAGILLYNRIKNESFIAFSQTQQAVGDSLIITPGLADKNKKETLLFNPVIIHTTGGLKVNFSTGYLLSFIGNDKYSEYTDASGQKGVIQQKRNTVTHAIGALAHVYPRRCGSVTPGLTAGVSLTASGDAGFYLGASALFLERNRLAITAGISEVKVDRIDTGNLGAETASGSGKFPYLNTANTAPVYNSIYRTAFFIGITYNIFSGK